MFYEFPAGHGGGVRVRDPQGQVWRVSRRWVPWRRRLKGWLGETFSWLTIGDDPVSLVLLVVVGIPFLLVAVLALAELLLLLLVLPFALLLRVAFGRHWVVEVRRGFRIWWEDDGGDWRASGTRLHDLAAAIGRGDVPEQNVDAPDPD
jgi:hypothetical protein